MTVVVYVVSAMAALVTVAAALGFITGCVGTLITFAKATSELKFLRERSEAAQDEAKELVILANRIIHRSALHNVVSDQQADETDYTKN